MPQFLKVQIKILIKYFFRRVSFEQYFVATFSDGQRKKNKNKNDLIQDL